jgi:leucyl aminopeptidase (aminopeptidase T)
MPRPSQVRLPGDSDLGRPAEAIARLVVDRCLGVRSGETVTIETWTHAIPWARPFVLEVRRRGAIPTLVVEDEDAFFRSLALPGARDVPLAASALAEQSDAYVYLGGPEAFPRLLGLPPDDLESVIVRHDPAWWRAARRVGLRAARLAIAGVTETAAARYGVRLEGWRREVIRASLVPPDRLARAAEPIVRGLAGARRVEIRHPNGTKLTVELDRRPALVEDGRVDRADRRAGRIWTQIPTGLVAVPLALHSAQGIWESNRAVYDRFAEPSIALGARFSFARGRLREFAFDRGGESFGAEYARGGRGRDVPGALTFGLNPGIARAPEVGEIAAGAVGLLLGDSRPIGGRNTSRFSYLTTLAEADVDLDGRPWIVGGRRPHARRRASPEARGLIRAGRRTRPAVPAPVPGAGRRSVPR